MTKITTSVRSSVRQALTHNDYDVSTMRISRDGLVSALRDADKTFNAPETARIYIGDVSQVLADYGTRA